MTKLFLNCMIVMLLTAFMPHTKETNRLQYQIWIGDKQAGSLCVEKVFSSEQECVFSMKTQVDFMFWEISSTIESKFRQNQLWEACANEKVNGKTKGCTKTFFVDNQYEIKKDNIKKIVKEPIYYSVAMLYHHEPEQVRQVFAERHANFCLIKEIASHKYELSLPNGDKNYYLYENGICKEMQTSTMMKKIRFVLVR